MTATLLPVLSESSFLHCALSSSCRFYNRLDCNWTSSHTIYRQTKNESESTSPPINLSDWSQDLVILLTGVCVECLLCEIVSLIVGSSKRFRNVVRMLLPVWKRRKEKMSNFRIIQYTVRFSTNHSIIRPLNVNNATIKSSSSSLSLSLSFILSQAFTEKYFITK